MSKQKRNRLIIVVIIAYLIVVATAAVIVDGRHVRFIMNGDAEMTLECGQPFVEPGVSAVTTGRLFGDGKKPLNVAATGLPDSSVPGRYELRYSARYMLDSYHTGRVVNVVDTTAPVITLQHSEGYEPTWMSGYVEEGYTATDNADGDVSDRVEVYEEAGRRIYTVTDSAGNTATAERIIDLTERPPVLTLLGDENTVLRAGTDEYRDAGCQAVDALGNDISDRLEMWTDVVPYASGVYDVVYSIYNDAGEAVSVSRTVTVLPAETHETVTPDGKTIYLTFDDGPGPYTEALLDLLAKYDAKVTFFVTGQFPKYFSSIGRAYREGHSVGVHTYSHDWYDVYSSEDAFFADFNAMQEVIREQTGSTTKLYRFPGGSSNTVSKSYNPGIVSRLAKSLTDLGYCYFDWNVSSGDAGETTKTSRIVENIKTECAKHRVSIVLQHDIKDYSVAAVEDVLIWGLKNGYSFRALDTTSPNAHHEIAN